MKRVVVSGAGGFIGSQVVGRLRRMGVPVVAVARRSGPGIDVVQPLPPEGDWGQVLRAGDALINCAGLAHRRADPASHDQINGRAVLGLAEQLHSAGGGPLVQVSTLAVYGPLHRHGALRLGDATCPQTAYGRAKLLAEEGLRAFPDRGLPVVIVRLPAVHGPGARGALATAARLLVKGGRLPVFRHLGNHRSFCALDSVVDALVLAATGQVPPGTWQVADAEPLSTDRMLIALAHGLGLEERLVRFPGSWLRHGALAWSRLRAVDRIAGDLSVDWSALASSSPWRPAPSSVPGLIAMGRSLRATEGDP